MRVRTHLKQFLATTHALQSCGLLGGLRARGVSGAAARNLKLAAVRSSGPSGARSVSDFTTSELKRLLSERGVDFRDCLEKGELVARLQSALRGDDGGGAAAPGGYGSLLGLSEGEQSVVKLFQRVAPSVAFIQTSTVKATSPLSLRGEITPQGSGSGFVWDAEGHVVTNYHVIQQAQKATVSGLGTGDAASMANYDAVLVGAELCRIPPLVLGYPKNSSKISTAVKSNSFPTILGPFVFAPRVLDD